jgi:hypothetical protein
LVQIKASKAEIDRRIAAFLRKKQLDVDIHNQREFCNLLHTENGRLSCLVAAGTIPNTQLIVCPSLLYLPFYVCQSLVARGSMQYFCHELVRKAI